LELASEVYLPHWFPLFWQAIREYQRHTSTASMIDRMISPLVGTAIALLSLAMAGLIGWKGRVQPADSPAFARVLSMVLAVTALVAPPSAPYNQVLLLPAVLLLVRGRGEIWQGGIAGQFLIALTVFATGWPWITAVLLSALSFVLPSITVQRFWSVPFATVWLIPLALAALMLAVTYRESLASSRERIPV
jgi:hypothetical protein